MRDLILAIDQGTTGSTALVVDAAGRVLAVRNQEFTNYFPSPGLVEHDADEIWASVAAAVAGVLSQIDASRIAAIGITNQRETSLFWDQRGAALGRALVWQDRRTTDRCAALRADGWEPTITARTGLLLDPYFSGTKAEWMLQNRPGLAAAAAAGDARFGTIDSYLVYRLCGEHVTDPSNASRTLLFDIHRLQWDAELCGLFGVPLACLPRIVDNAGIIGHTRGVGFLPDGIPVAGIAGDQQSALFGQGCFTPGMAKCTYGTGAFALFNTGNKAVASANRLLTTVAWRLNGQASYALEGSAFVAGAAVQWLRDGLQFFRSSAEIEALAAEVSDSGGVVFVPALAGLGAPHWRPEARGIFTGLTRGTTRAHVARAVLEGIGHEVADMLEAMAKDAGAPITELRVDGGAARNNLLMQFQADMLGVPCVRPKNLETTAFGAAFLAGLGVGIYDSPDAITRTWAEDRRFDPAMPADAVATSRAAWTAAVARA